jgi:alpha-tubulin suppressor-like RCC1 family protein
MTTLIPRAFGVLAAVLGAGLFSTGCGEDAAPTEAPSAPSPAEALTIATQALVFYQVSMGDMHTCGITTAGRAYCWGNNFSGQLGDGTRTSRLLPTPVAGSLVFRNVSAGQNHTCGVTTDFLAYCWGESIDGRLGTGTTAPHITPSRVAGGLKFRVVAAGGVHSCALTVPDERAYCWGNNSLGQLGDGTTTVRDKPVPVAGGRRFRQVTTGALHTCAVTPAYQGYCWGWDSEGQLGDGATRQNRSRPSLVVGGHPFTQISAGFTNTCAVTTTARAFCWGHSPVGDGSTLQRFEPRAVSGNLSFSRVTAGDSHMCGETTSKQAYCWGINSLGSLGNGVGSGIKTKPVAVNGGLLFAQLSAGRGTCGKTPEGAAYCWGENSDGQLGDGTTVSRFVPTLVANPQ